MNATNSLMFADDEILFTQVKENTIDVMRKLKEKCEKFIQFLKSRCVCVRWTNKYLTNERCTRRTLNIDI